MQGCSRSSRCGEGWLAVSRTGSLLSSCHSADPAVLHSVGKSHENEIRYHPFRMTPYLVKVRDPQGAEGQLCCVLLAERVHSGYEGESPAQAGAQAPCGASVSPVAHP